MDSISKELDIIAGDILTESQDERIPVEQRAWMVSKAKQLQRLAERTRNAAKVF